METVKMTVRLTPAEAAMRDLINEGAGDKALADSVTYMRGLEDRAKQFGIPWSQARARGEANYER